MSRVLRLARWPLVRAILPTSATMSRPAMPISGAMLKISGMSRTCSSTNGTVVVNGATSVCIQVEPGRSAQLNPGDELKLGESTTYAILLGAL